MVRKFVREHFNREKKPTFNVVKPFLGTTIIQMNGEMRHELASFLELFDEDGLEQDLIDLTANLQQDQSGTSVSFKHYDENEQPRSYLITQEFEGVITIILSEAARQLIIEVIQECEGSVDKIIWALRLALEDPTGGPRSKPEYKKRNYNRNYRRCNS